MQVNYWAVQIEKNKKGKVCLKFCGHFYISPKQIAYVITFLVAVGSTISYVIRYFQ